MIASVRGEVLATGLSWAVVAVGGVGLRLETPGARVSVRVGSEAFFHTHLIVREDALTLYGFETLDELEVFGVLIGVSGVGPRSALGVLAALTPAEVARAVGNEDEKPFRAVSGIGPKTAKMITVQLNGKLDARKYADGSPEQVVPQSAAEGVATNVVAGLVNLGYSETQALSAVADAASAGAPDDESGLLRATLALLQAPRVNTRGGKS